MKQKTALVLGAGGFIEGIRRLMNSEFIGPVNIGSEEIVTINDLVEMACSFENKRIYKTLRKGILDLK